MAADEAIAYYRSARDAYYRSARDAYYAAGVRADAAFARYFSKIQAGEKTNGAAVSRLENETNDRSRDLYSAQSELYRLDLDPWDVDDADGVERSPIGSSGYN